MERKKWFLDRIGNTIYRSAVTCDCEHCKDVYENGIKIADKQHSDYLYDWDCITSSMDYPKQPVRYFDTIKERNDYELNYNLSNILAKN